MADEPEQPQGGQPQWGQPQGGQPQWGQPQGGQPQWGQPQWGPPPGYGYPVPPRNSERSIWVAVTGIGSIVVFFTCCLGVVPAIVALCLAPGARRELATSGGSLTGDGLIRAGVICSWITIGITVLAVIAFGLFLSAWEWSIGESVDWSST